MSMLSRRTEGVSRDGVRTFTHGCGVDDRCAGERVVSIASVEVSIGTEKSNPACVRTGLGVASLVASASAGVLLILSYHRHST